MTLKILCSELLQLINFQSYKIRSGLVMNYQASSSQNDFHSVITPEQFNNIIAAITDGRYSWACVLILRCIDYNPIHYIPQRTYSRLMKENRQIITPITSSQQKQKADVSTSVNSSNYRDSSQLLTTAKR